MKKKAWIWAAAVTLLACVCVAVIRPGAQTQDPAVLAAEACRDLWDSADGWDQAKTDEAEQYLIGQGYPVLDTDGVYPTYLANSGELRSFWDSVQAGKTAELEIIKFRENGGFFHYLFQKEGESETVTCTIIARGGSVESQETYPFYDWALADWDVFYYQIYPEDFHYDKYAQIALNPPDRELCDWNQTYIEPVGYQFVNLFLCDWQEGEWGELSFSDLFDYLHRMRYGGLPDESGWPYMGDPSYVMVPAAVFEKTVMPYFAISLENFREAALYDEEADIYPWWVIHTNMMIHYPRLESHVTACSSNPDGTVTLQVNVTSPDYIAESIFRHEVTVRLLDGGGFQYVGNRVTYVSEYGLPPAEPRRTLEK